jgi:ABC-type phosphate transport system substrate-binding protein
MSALLRPDADTCSRMLHTRISALAAFALTALALLMVLASPVRSQAPARRVYVVVNVANPIDQIDRDQLSSIFLKRVSRWPNGQPADPVDLAPTVVPRAHFSESVHKRSVGAVLAFWQQQIFSGRDVPPVEQRSERDVLAYVSEHPDAVGYVAVSTDLPAGVKTIEVRGAKP